MPPELIQNCVESAQQNDGYTQVRSTDDQIFAIIKKQELGERGRAFNVLQVDQSTVRYLSRRGDNADPREAIKRVSRARHRIGCRRIHMMIARGGLR